MISIIGMGSISPLGCEREQIKQNYKTPQHHLTEKEGYISGFISPEDRSKLRESFQTNKYYPKLDKTVQQAIFASRLAVREAKIDDRQIGINIGSSRGATESFERYHRSLISQGEVSHLSSPLTTLGNISSWVAQDLQSSGIAISHSITCSTALHSILNGIAWLQSGLCSTFLAGGSEAPLTPFTWKQMDALKIYGKKNTAYPCLSGDQNKTENTMIMGEGAACFVLTREPSPKDLGRIVSWGFASESIRNPVSMSPDAEALQQAIQNALADGVTPDLIISHMPGTIQGDRAEYRAIQKVFGKKHPPITGNKWKIGHSLGASGALSLEMAVLMLQEQRFFPIPYLKNHRLPQKIESIMINAMGFGGNAVSIVVGI